VRVRRAIFFSDVHLGWVPLAAHHELFLRHLPAAVDDAELVVLNGDVLDDHRGRPSSRVQELVGVLAEQVAGWRREGRQVVYIEGNHDPRERARAALRPDTWCHTFEGAHGERIRVLHGHKLDDPGPPEGAYEGYGKHLLRAENWLYARSALLRAVYPHSIGWLVGAVGLTEDRLWRPRFYAEVGRRFSGNGEDRTDVLVHGHFHFGPGSVHLPRRTPGGTRPAGQPIELHRSGAWVSPGHLGTVDRLLRYRHGCFERMQLQEGRWRPSTDGR
jgi:UDP-2,3-diacylglucosamine pyrophosphatase LpxH